MTVRIKLSPKLDVEASKALAGVLLGKRGADIVLDAADVQHLGAYAIQLLATAAHSWRQDGKTLSLENMPHDQAEFLASIGLPPTYFMTMENAG